MKDSHKLWISLAAIAAMSLAVPALARAVKADEEDKIVLAAGEEPPKDHVRPQVFLSVDRLPAGGTCRVAVMLDVESGWHINTNPARPEFVVPTTIKFKSEHGTKLAGIEYPTGKDLLIEGADIPQSVYEGQVLLFGTLTIPEGAARETEELTVEIKFQACNERQCLAPKTKKLIGKVPVAAPGETVKTVNEKVFEKDEKDKARKDRDRDAA